MNSNGVSPRERLFTVLDFKEPDRVPVTVRSVKPMEYLWANQDERLEVLLGLGVDEPVRVVPRFPRHPEVSVRSWTEEADPYPIRHTEFETPAGTLHVSARQTPDWSPEDIPLFSDHIWSRGVEYLIKKRDDLPALEYVLCEPRDADITGFLEQAKAARKKADEHGTWLQSSFHGGAIETMSLLGSKNMMFLLHDDRELVEATLDCVSRWGDRLLEVILDAAVDVVYRSGCYETIDFWSPAQVRELFMPILARQTAMCHQAGVRMHHFIETGGMPFLEDYAEIGIDIFSALDDNGTNPMDLAECKRVLGGRVCLWGGVDPREAFERGSTEDVRREVLRVLRIMAPGGGYVLSTTGSFQEMAKEENVRAYIEAGKELGEYPLSLPAD